MASFLDLIQNKVNLVVNAAIDKVTFIRKKFNQPPKEETPITKPKEAPKSLSTTQVNQKNDLETVINTISDSEYDKIRTLGDTLLGAISGKEPSPPGSKQPNDRQH